MNKEEHRSDPEGKLDEREREKQKQTEAERGRERERERENMFLMPSPVYVKLYS
jgi:hypothetical protein